MQRLSIVLLASLLLLARAAVAHELPRLTAVARTSAATASPGDTLTISYRFATGTAPVNSVQFSVGDPTFAFQRNFSGDAAQGTVSLTVTKDWINGTYTLFSATASTLYGRSNSFGLDGTPEFFDHLAAGITPRLDTVKFTITHATDAYVVPAITSLARTGGATFSPGNAIVFSDTFTTGTSDLIQVRLQIRDPAQRTLNVNLPLTSPGTATLTPGTDWLNGAYTVIAARVTDAGRNSFIYNRTGLVTDAIGRSSAHSLNLAPLDFTVINAAATIVFPRLNQLFNADRLEGRVRQLHAGESFKLGFGITGGTSAVRSVAVRFEALEAGGDTMTFTTTDPDTDQINLVVPADLSPASYFLTAAIIVDAQGRTIEYDRDGSVISATPTTRGSHNLIFGTMDFAVTAPLPGRLANLAIRSAVPAGGAPLIAGFTLGGAGTSGSRRLLLRGVGPTLTTLGVAGALADPSLVVFAGANAILDNDNWAGAETVRTLSAAVGAFPLSSATSADAALALPTATAGGYSVQIVGKNATGGIALAEVYDASAPVELAAATPRLINLSARTSVGTGGDILIAGFVIADGPRTVLIRAIGPTLTALGVPGALVDPQLTVYSADGTKVAASDDWSGDPALAAAFAKAGAFSLPAASKDAAMAFTLPPGSYTAQVSGVVGTTGVAVVEVYEVP